MHITCNYCHYLWQYSQFCLVFWAPIHCYLSSHPLCFYCCCLFLTLVHDMLLLSLPGAIHSVLLLLGSNYFHDLGQYSQCCMVFWSHMHCYFSAHPLRFCFRRLFFTLLHYNLCYSFQCCLVLRTLIHWYLSSRALLFLY